MKDSAVTFSKSLRVTSLAALVSAGACSKSNKAHEVAQDSILVKDADVAGQKTDTAGAATAALMRERGASGAQRPALTNGAQVTRTTDGAPPVGSTPTSSQPRVLPPRRVNPSPVLPPREPSGNPMEPVSASPTTPQPTIQPPPVAQPIPPSPPPVSQPTPPTPKRDSSKDSLTVRRS
ncbi:MAG: hypothetical protein H0W63_10655 [Gemmatimonadaceae bacterium]|nr:hypothetical protein [Gemmatimonadaceae bacterium]